jgi:hypothetical protein
MGDFMDSEATDEERRQWWLEYQVELEQASYKALLKVHENSANLDGCETCAQNEAIIRRLMTAEGEPQDREHHSTLREVYHNSGPGSVRGRIASFPAARRAARTRASAGAACRRAPRGRQATTCRGTTTCTP